LGTGRGEGFSRRISLERKRNAYPNQCPMMAPRKIIARGREPKTQDYGEKEKKKR